MNRPEPPYCSHWDGQAWCGLFATHRYVVGFRCEWHRPGQPGAQR